METKFSNDWEPLPPRRKKVRNSNACVNFSNSADKQESPINSIAASIVARSEQKNEEAKLEDQDGCSSEFYECKCS